MSNRFVAQIAPESTEFCCGLIQCGDLRLNEVKPTRYDSWSRKEVPVPEYDRAATTEKAAWQEALNWIREENRLFPLCFNIIKDHLETLELRELLNEQADAYHVHTWRNRNSYNVLEMYVLTNGSNEDQLEEEEDDED